MRFDVFGPYEIERTKKIITRENIDCLKARLTESGQYEVLTGPGCYVFGVKNQSIVPWYVGKSENQPLFKEATTSKLQVYNELLIEYEKGKPVLFFLPAMTASWQKTKAPTKSEIPSVDFLEDWLIAVALQRNADLLNIKKTKKLRELSIRGIVNAEQGEATTASSALKKALNL